MKFLIIINLFCLVSFAMTIEEKRVGGIISAKVLDPVHPVTQYLFAATKLSYVYKKSKALNSSTKIHRGLIDPEVSKDLIDPFGPWL